MNTDIFTIIVAALGFLLSIFVLILTRWERRSTIVIHMFRCFSDRFGSEVVNDSEESIELIGIRVINPGVKSIILDSEGFEIQGNGKKISRFDTDWLGIDKIPHPLNPGTSCEVAIFTDAFEEILGREELKKYMNMDDYEKCIIPIDISVKLSNGRIFSARQYYNFYVSDFWSMR
jgi:hypothetical protein